MRTNGRSCVVLADDDPEITAGLAAVMERRGRTTILCSDIDAAEIALAYYPVTHLVTDVQFSGEFGFEGLHFLTRIRKSAPECRVVLMSGNPTDALRAAATGLGTALLEKPFTIAELERELAIDDDSSSEPYRVIRFPTIETLVRGDELYPVFQPIVRLSSSGVSLFGFEALTRGRGAWMIGGPSMLFEYATNRTALVPLNLALLRFSIAAAAELPKDSTLFLNVDPLCFDSEALPATIEKAARAASVSCSRIVVEITERCALPDDATATRICEELRALGVRLAMDDHGSAYSHLLLVDRIKPSFMKVSNSFGTAFDSDPTKTAIIEHMLTLAANLGCETILEGIETATTAEAAKAAGVSLAQGFHFGRPAPADVWRDCNNSSILQRSACAIT